MQIRILPSRLNRERRTWDLSQHKLALLLGYTSASYVSRVERGEIAPSLNFLLGCELIFDLPFKDLFPERVAKIEDDIATRAYELLESMAQKNGLGALKQKALFARVIEQTIHRSSTNSNPHENNQA